MNDFKIGSRIIGPEAKPFVIAEVGINHEGDIRKALQLVDAAVEAKADCVKFQCHIVEEEMIPTDMKPGKISDEKLWDIIKRCQLTESEERQVKAYCEKKGILYLSTPFSRAAADRLESMGVLGYKIGSGECNNYPLLDHVSRFRKPTILSTGMNDLKAIKQAVAIFQRNKCPIMLMHCTSMYPTPYEKVRLNGITELIKTFKLPVGLSDHSMGIYTCIAGVALGAVALEKHFTMTRSWPGPDVPISIEPQELAELVKGSEAVWKARGGRKTILKEEKPVIDFAYASVVTIKDVARGEKFTRDNLWVKRPGTGHFLAKDYLRLLGKRAKRDVPTNTQISPDHLLN